MRKFKWTLLALLGAAAAAWAGDTWHLLVEPKFMGYPESLPIQGSDRTVLVPARFSNGEIQPLKKGDPWDEVKKNADASADAILASLKPEYVRDGNQVIQYAVLKSDSPLTASAVLAPGFGKLFAETIGPDLLVAIPNRHLVYIFPKQSLVFQTFADMIYAEYQSSSDPVSRELFEWRKGKLIAIGSYR